jgi:hypothetical protein
VRGSSPRPAFPRQIQPPQDHRIQHSKLLCSERTSPRTATMDEVTSTAQIGFEPRNAMIVSADLGMAGYNGDKLLEMQKRMVEAMQTIPGVESVGLIDWAPLISGAYGESDIFTGETADLRPSNAAAVSFRFRISPEYFQAARTALLSGRTFTLHETQRP